MSHDVDDQVRMNADANVAVIKDTCYGTGCPID